jgi:hypothetical protein
VGVRNNGRSPALGVAVRATGWVEQKLGDRESADLDIDAAPLAWVVWFGMVRDHPLLVDIPPGGVEYVNGVRYPPSKSCRLAVDSGVAPALAVEATWPLSAQRIRLVVSSTTGDVLTHNLGCEVTTERFGFTRVSCVDWPAVVTHVGLASLLGRPLIETSTVNDFAYTLRFVAVITKGRSLVPRWACRTTSIITARPT